MVPRRGLSQEEVTRARILDGAFERAERLGLARTTMADVARAARLSRQTVYRYFSSKHALFAALVLREEERLIELVRAAVGGEGEPRSVIEAGILTCLRWLREHPLLDPIMKAEPEELLPYLTVEAHPVLALGMRAAEEIFGERLPGASPALIHRAAETWARLMVSYAITPPVEPPEEVSASLAELFFGGLDGS